MKRRAIAVVVGAALLAAQHPARTTLAQPRATADQQVVELFRRGRALMDARRFAEAVPVFEQVLAARDSAGARFNLGLSLRALDRCREALAAFQRVVATDSDEARRESARVNADELRSCVGRVVVQLNGDHPSLRVDGVEAVVTSDQAVLTLDPGEHVLEASGAGGWSAREVVALSRGGQRVVTMDVTDPNADPPPRDERTVAPGRGRRAEPEATTRPWQIASWVAGGLAGATAGFALGIGLLAQARYNDLAYGCAPTCTTGDVEDIEHREALVNGLVVSSAVFAAATVMAVILDRMLDRQVAETRRGERRRPALAVMPVTGGAMLVLGGAL